MTDPGQPSIKELAEEVGRSHDADVLVYGGAMASPWDDHVIELIHEEKSQENLFFIFATYGGSPDCAFRIARCLQQTYGDGKLILALESICKSAGTLLAIGFDEIIMADKSELGPLDVQLLKKDEVGEYSSGLNSMQALTVLQNESAMLFLRHFNQLHDPRVGFSTRLAADIAAQHTGKLFGEIFSQIDPMRLGEEQRAMFIGQEYGTRLARKNVPPSTVSKLVAGYPSHGFVIDRLEAESLFVNVRAPSETEDGLLAQLKGTISASLLDTKPLMEYLFSGGSAGRKTEEGHTDEEDRESGRSENEHREDPSTAEPSIGATSGSGGPDWEEIKAN